MRHSNDIAVAGIHLVEQRVAASVMMIAEESLLERGGAVMDMVLAAAFHMTARAVPINVPGE